MEDPAYKLSGLVVALPLLAIVPAAFAQQTSSLHQVVFRPTGPDADVSRQLQWR
jgi:hypothetical protein